MRHRWMQTYLLAYYGAIPKRDYISLIWEAAETSITEEYTEWLNEKWFCFLFQLFSVNRFL